MGGGGSRQIEPHIERANINLNIFKFREKFESTSAREVPVPSMNASEVVKDV